MKFFLNKLDRKKELLGPNPTQSPAVRYGHLAKLILTKFQLGYEGRDIKILEIGAWTGSSSCLISLLISKLIGASRISPNSKLTIIDPWSEYFSAANIAKHYKDMSNNLSNGQAERYFKINLARYGEPRVCSIMKDFSENVLGKIEAKTFDLIYIDGSHSYLNSKYDMEQSIRLVKNDGIICGDDLETLTINNNDLHNKSLAEEKDFVDGYHPGVTQAFLDTFQMPERCMIDGFWAVKKGERFEGLCEYSSLKAFSLIPYWIPLSTNIYLGYEDKIKHENHIISSRGVFTVSHDMGHITYSSLKIHHKNIRFLASRKEFFDLQIKKELYPEIN
jgi:predicted O-methyltransferase YrrM